MFFITINKMSADRHWSAGDLPLPCGAQVLWNEVWYPGYRLQAETDE